MHSQGWWARLVMDQHYLYQSKDEIEKASQVAQTGDVYTYADQVIVWLGGAEDESDMALEMMP
jgi:Heterokaryon incompatibility protein (HET)